MAICVKNKAKKVVGETTSWDGLGHQAIRKLLSASAIFFFCRFFVIVVTASFAK